jgi:hypothetical protein
MRHLVEQVLKPQEGADPFVQGVFKGNLHRWGIPCRV